MKKIIVYFVFLYLLCYTPHSFAQSMDSLWLVYNDKNKPDTDRINAIYLIAWNYIGNNPDTAIILAQQELELAQSGKKKKQEATALTTLGICYKNKGNFPKALNYYLKALKVFEEIGYKKGIGGSCVNIGSIYYYQTNYAQAISYYFKALKIREEINDKKGIAVCYNNIGNVYGEQKDYSNALVYYFKALKMQEEAGDKSGMAAAYTNIGDIYRYQSIFNEALDYYSKGLKLRKEVDDKQGVGLCYGNMATLFLKSAKFELSIQYSDSELILCKEIGDVDGEREAYENLAGAYSKTRKYKEAYEYHVKFKTLTDSLFNDENSKQLGDLKTQFEVDKKEVELKIKSEAEQEKLKAVAAEEKKRQNVIIGAVAGVLILVVVFSLFLLNRFRITQKQKKIIEQQKIRVDEAYEHLHEKNKEVMDSIFYARRIQSALLPNEKYISKTFTRLRS